MADYLYESLWFLKMITKDMLKILKIFLWIKEKKFYLSQ
jgi:hypothetical protein